MNRETIILDPDKTVVSVKLLYAAIVTCSTAAVSVAILFMSQNYKNQAAIQQINQKMTQLVAIGQMQSWSDDLREANPGLHVPRIPRWPQSTSEFSPVVVATTRVDSQKE